MIFLPIAFSFSNLQKMARVVGGCWAMTINIPWARKLLRFYGLVRSRILRSSTPDNKSLDASGGSVFLILIRPAMLEWIRAAASTQPFDAMSNESHISAL